MEVEHELAGRLIRRRPVPIAGYGIEPDISNLELRPPSPPSPPLPPRPQVRPSRSVTHLKQVQNLTTLSRPANGLKPAIIDNKSTLPVGFVADTVPSPASLAPEPGRDIRRVKSSSALSASVEVDPQSDASRPKEASKWKAALGEAQYFAGGLITHPSESTRHYSIIRHSHALVWYRGPSTSVSITILSDELLPASRSLWLQQKGYSGNMGMTLKALAGTTGSWINVTPERRAGLENISDADERGIQRDLKRFAKKASGRQAKHVPRETHVVRIPATATDGYFRLVVCASEEGKKVLCGSPVFRVASTSTDASVVRGASLSTMPLEMGVKVASTIGQAVVERYTGVAQTVVKSQAGKLVTNTTVKTVGRVAYDGYLGDAMNERWEKAQQRKNESSLMSEMATSSMRAIGSEAGPEAPFPMELDGRVVKGTGKSVVELGIPTANLSGISDVIKMRMGGVFAAWACIQPPKNASQADISPAWHEAIVTIAPLRNAPPEVVMKNGVVVHIIHDFAGAHFFEFKVKVLLMGYLHPAASLSTGLDDLVVELSRDVATTLASLGREAWGPQQTVDSLRTLKKEKTFSDKLDDATGKVHQQVDRMPLHWAGVRSESGAMQDKIYGNGGIWIPR